MSTSTPLLTTKLCLPPARAKLISRPRLIERLADGLTRPLTLISAPAGFGKTTLVSECIHAGILHPAEIAWLSLDADDNDPTRFFTYLVAALQARHATIGETALALLRSTPPPLPLARLRPRDQLVEIRTVDLRFTPDEAAQFMGG